jgi:hypothetical protein
MVAKILNANGAKITNFAKKFAAFAQFALKGLDNSTESTHEPNLFAVEPLVVCSGGIPQLV